MATFYCSVIVPPCRFVNREKYDALCMWDAFLQVSHKYKALKRFSCVYKIEYRGKYRYFDSDGKELDRASCAQ